MNLNQSLHPFQWEASQHSSYLLKHRRVSRLCWHLQSSPHNHTATRAEIRLCFSNTILSRRHSQDLLRQNYARAHASSASLHVSSGNVLIAHSSNTDFSIHLQDTTTHMLAPGGRSDSFPLQRLCTHFSIISLPEPPFPTTPFPVLDPRYHHHQQVGWSSPAALLPWISGQDGVPGDALNFAP